MISQKDAYPAIQVVPFDPQHQSEINRFMRAIEREFSEPISTSNPNAKSITTMASGSASKYWVALADGKAVGTLGLTVLANRAVVLTRVFLAERFRGTGAARSLLEASLVFARANAVRAVYLGTMEQFKAAQKFYEKNGFTRIDKDLLPADFPVNPIDAVFYKSTLS